MKTPRIRDFALSLAGLLALTVAILACTSFSPDDKKVLYPAFDRASGALGMALYDRQAHRSDMFFLPIAYENGTNSEPAPTFIRGQWLPNGRSILFCWAGGKDTEDKALNLALMPWNGKPGLKLFRVPMPKDPAAQLLYPLCIAHHSVFFLPDSKETVRLDLNTGALTHHTFTNAAQEITLMPALDGEGIFYFEQPGTFGRLDPQSFRLTPLMILTNSPAEDSFFAYDRQGKRVAFVEGNAGTNRLVVVSQGQTTFSRPLFSVGGKVGFGNALLSLKGDRVWATYEEPAGSNTVSFGFMEIPLSDAPVRKTTLIAAAPAGKDSDASLFQFGLSHDGKTAAVASTYLAAADNPIKAEDCALFLIDLSAPNRKVTKIPLPGPLPATQKP